MTSASEVLERIGSSIQGNRSFGPVVERDGVTVIPVAYVFGGGGGGSGSEKSPEPSAPPKVGSGGGFGLVSWPIGAYVISNGQVKFRPVIDPFLATGLIRFVLGRLMRKR
jgi:uncharacterized spore protein YtfJ